MIVSASTLDCQGALPVQACEDDSPAGLNKASQAVDVPGGCFGYLVCGVLHVRCCEQARLVGHRADVDMKQPGGGLEALGCHCHDRVLDGVRASPLLTPVAPEPEPPRC